jgi:hypothetical protein
VRGLKFFPGPALHIVHMRKEKAQSFTFHKRIMGLLSQGPAGLLSPGGAPFCNLFRGATGVLFSGALPLSYVNASKKQQAPEMSCFSFSCFDGFCFWYLDLILINSPSSSLQGSLWVYKSANNQNETWVI